MNKDNWISVKDNMPKDNQKVEVLFDNGPLESSAIFWADSNIFAGTRNFVDHKPESVTHWR